jgi:hypothetical protein
MYTYNVTIKVHHSIQQQWLTWMHTIHMPEILALDLFYEAKLSELIEPLEPNDDGVTYTAQYSAHSKAQYNAYISKHAAHFRQLGIEAFGDKFIAFRSLSQTVVALTASN